MGSSGICQDSGKCSEEDRCFRGTGKSSTFILDKENPTETMIQFGSGPIWATVATDVVHLGNMKVNMTDGVLLMTDKQLDFSGSFEGILGLGLPPKIQNKKMNAHKKKGDLGEGLTLDRLRDAIQKRSRKARVSKYFHGKQPTNNSSGDDES